MIFFINEEVVVLALRNDYGSNLDTMKEELHNMGEDGYLMLSIIEFTFSPCVSFLMSVLNAHFCSKVGNKAYPSTNVIYDGTVLFNNGNK